MVDAPLQLLEGELGRLSVSLCFLRTVPNALVARPGALEPTRSGARLIADQVQFKRLELGAHTPAGTGQVHYAAPSNG